MMTSYAVFTGDLIASRQHDPADVQAALAMLSATIASGGATVLPLSRHRGDGWQCVIDQPGLALRLALLLIVTLRRGGPVESRIAIGIGSVDRIDTESPGNSQGEAFVTSGHLLDHMPRDRILAFDGNGIRAQDRIIANLLATLARSLTPKQAEVAAVALIQPQPTLREIGAALGITPQSVDDRMTAGQIKPMLAALADWEDAYSRDGQIA